MKIIFLALILTLLSACATMHTLGFYNPSGYYYVPVDYGYTPAYNQYTQNELSNLQLSNDQAQQRELYQATQDIPAAPTYMPPVIPINSAPYDPTIMPGNQAIGPALPVVTIPTAPSQNPFVCYDVDSC